MRGRVMCAAALSCADWVTVMPIASLLSVLEPLGLLAQAEDDAVLFLGEDFLPWMVLALGAAMVVGNIAALTRPPESQGGPTGSDTAVGDAGSGGAAARPAAGRASARPPVARATVMIVVGLVAAVWGLASLVMG